MGGKGGPMGGMMGGKGGPPPKPKAVTAKEARDALNALMALLNDPEARKQVQAAMQQITQQTQAQPDMKAEAKAQQRMQTLVPVMSQLAAPLTAKYGWKGGFMEMVASIGEHAKKDQSIARDLEPLRMLMMGEHPMASKGKIAQFDSLARDFGIKNATAQAEVIAQTEAAIAKNTVDGKLSKPLGKYYLKIMNKIVAEGATAAPRPPQTTEPNAS